MNGALAPEAPGLDRHEGTEPILAWRTWSLTGRPDGSGLLLRAVGRHHRVWPPSEAAEGACRAHPLHDVPSPSCRCGLYATRSEAVLRRTRCPGVLGRVALWGRVVEHDLGFRARYAYPQRMRLVCQFCFWMWGQLSAPPDVVGWYPHGQLVPLCDEHVGAAQRHGMTPRWVLPADAVDQELRARYAVDPLAV